ncbi:MAG: helix-turn-helix transcriptional regulator [Bacilli bacterium]|nr:helix-turn-helix transcriptional regulator [Bacilli bacterium]
MDIGSKIRMLRDNHNISQEKLANILNINRNYLSRIETGKSEPSLKVLKDVAKYFKVDITTLMDIQTNGSNSEEKIKKIIDGCEHLLDGDLDFLIRMISVMREEYVKKD